MKISDFDYDLPEERIAQFPPKVRGHSRLLVIDRKTGEFEHRQYEDVYEFLEPGDVVVLNNTKVIKARLLAKNTSGSDREFLLIEEHGNLTSHNIRTALHRGKVHAGETLKVGNTAIVVTKILGNGLVEISCSEDLLLLADHEGSVPLPPYMHRTATQQDTDRYQTVFANKAGSVAAPTASLNFTDELLKKLQAKGVKIAYLTLHVGLGTFMPIRTDDIEDHQMHSEYFEIPPETITATREAQAANHRVCAVGTTVTRTLEYAADQILQGSKTTLTGEADIFIYPGYKFKIVNMLLTNFHAPRTTVLMLAATFAGWNNLHSAYKEAAAKKYAFLSYGDSMLII